jgi:hypothetical protein
VGALSWLQPLPHINDGDEAVAVAARLAALESRFRASGDPAERRMLAREIISLRAALTDYRLRSPDRERTALA